MADEKTKWTEGIEKAGKTALKLGEMAYCSDHFDTDEAGKLLDLLLTAAREMDTEIIRLNLLLGVEATDEAVDNHLMLYGTTYLYHGRLLDPTKVGIKRLKLSSTNMLRDLGADSLEIVALNNGPIALRMRAWWDGKALRSTQAFNRKELREARDPYNMVLKRLKDNAHGHAQKERPCLKEVDSKTSSTGEKSRESTTASPEGTAESDTSPSAKSTSSPSPEDKPAGDPR